MTGSTSVLQSFLEDLRDVVAASRHPETLPGVAERLAEALAEAGLPVDRLQLPLSALFGLKHPLYLGIILTWVRGKGSTAWLRPIRKNQEAEARRLLAKSPFGPLVAGDCTEVRHRVGEPGWCALPALRPLEDDGFVDYLATVAELPDGARQVISIATRMEGGFGPDVQERLRLLKSPLALALYAIYQAQLAQQVATTYLGQRTGSLVLDGQMGRGRSASLRAGIAFLDIRGFTALSHELGVEGIVPLLNAVFEAIDEAVRPLGGEILKLIGDAALVVFPLEEEADSNLLAILRSLLDAGQSAWDATAELGQPLRLGCGFHTGDVLYGNVGSRSRHDFTVMGPAVNLASRLETLTKSLSADLVISHKVAHACRHSCGGPAGAEEALDASVRSYDAVSVPGVPEPLRVWTVNRRRSDEEEREG